MRLNVQRGGTGETLVLLHGIGSRLGAWEPVLPALWREFDVIALDLPGFGDSPMPPAGTVPGPDSLVRLVREALAALGVERPFHVAGNSLGGLLALELARQGVARSVCGLSPAGFGSGIEMRVTRTLLLSGSVSLARRLAPHADALMARPRSRMLLSGAFSAHPEREPAAAAAADLRALAAAPWFDATLPSVGGDWFAGRGVPDARALPITIAWGEHDRVLLPRGAERARRLMPGARIVTLEGCGHVPMWDDPIAVATVIRETARAAG